MYNMYKSLLMYTLREEKREKGKGEYVLYLKLIFYNYEQKLKAELN